MKKAFRYIFTVLSLMICVSAFAQDKSQDFKPHRDGTDWGARMRSEKIGFITAEVGLTPEEAQNFWPVYNKAEEEKGAAMFKVMSAYGELQKAFHEGKGDFSKILDEYLKANTLQAEIDLKYAKEYRKVLSEEKVAKLYLAEEKFRREQINKLNPAAGGGKFGQQPGR